MVSVLVFQHYKADREMNVKGAITAEQARAYKTRWVAANEAEVVELRTTSYALKARQLQALMSSVEQLGWTAALSAEESEVRNRWMMLRQRLARV